MNKKWFVRVIAIFMAAIMALSVLYVVVGSLTATAVTQSQIDSLKKKQQEIETKKNQIQSEINSLEYEQSSGLAKKEVLDDQIIYIQDEIDNVTEQIATYAQMIIEKEDEVVVAQAHEDEQLADYKARLRTMEENGTISYVAVIFNSSSFSDLLARVDIVGEVMQSDVDLYEQLKLSKQATIDAKNALEIAITEQEQQKAVLQVKQTELVTQVAAAEEILKKLEDDIEAAKDLYKQEAAESNTIQTDINNKIAALKKQNESGKGTVVGTGTLIWPTPSCTVVNSEFGRRLHPLYNEYRMHSGIDIPARYGASVLASDGGQVIISQYSSSYGNYIVISHGNGVTTLYAHLSSRLVKVGAAVDQGDIIGKVGSTGASTGPHLHYEVSVNGTRVNPLQYFTNYTIDT